MKNLSTLFFGILVSIILLSSCHSPENDLLISIDSAGWKIENIDPAYWLESPPQATLFISFSLHYTGDSIIYSDIESIRIDTSQGYYETYSGFELETEHRIIHLYGLNESGHTLEIGDYKFTVNLKNGTSAYYELTVPAPNSINTKGCSYIYSEDYTGYSYPEYTPMLHRATGITANQYTSSLTINFRISDSLCYSGWVQFYNQYDEFIGYTKEFRNYKTNQVASFVNGGSSLYSDTNNLNIGSQDMQLAPGTSISDIHSCIIILTDGGQYQYSDKTYDCLSISERVDFSSIIP